MTKKKPKGHNIGGTSNRKDVKRIKVSYTGVI